MVVYPNKIDIPKEAPSERQTDYAVSSTEQDTGPITVYKNPEGEIVFKVVDLIEAMESTPDQIKSLVSVRNISPEADVPGEETRSFMHNKLCIFCDNKVDLYKSSLFCQTCGRKEVLDTYESNMHYSFL